MAQDGQDKRGTPGAVAAADGHAGRTEMEAIVAATRSGAEICRISAVTGTIGPGKTAGLLMLAENPLADIGAIRRDNMMLIMKDGHMVKNEF